MYTNDSLLTLSGPQIAGVLAVAAGLCAIFLVIVLISSRGPWPIRLIVGISAAWAFDWLSPQIFYEYYRLILPGLPQQIVVGTPDPLSFARILTFQADASLSAHGRGVFFFILLIVSLFATRWHRRDAAN